MSGDFAASYYPKAVPGYKDESFVLLLAGQPLAAAGCWLGAGRLQNHVTPAIFDIAAGSEEQVSAAAEAALTVLLSVLEENPDAFLSFYDPDESVAQDAVRVRLSNEDAKVFDDVQAVVRLDKEPLDSGLRRRYRPMVNWGRQSLSLSYVNKGNPDRGLFDEYRSWHSRVARKITRPIESWNAMFDWICQGRGELVMARSANGSLASGVMTIDDLGSSYYMSGVNDRDSFDKPVSQGVAGSRH